MNVHWTWIKIYIILYVSLLSMPSCREKPAQEESAQVESNKDTSATPVKTAVCREGMFEYRIEANGIFKAEKEIKLYAAQGGVVTHCIGKPGGWVETGQTILQYDTTDLALKLERAEITRYNTAREYESQLLSYASIMTYKSDVEKTAIQKKIFISSGYALAEQEIKEINHTIRNSVIQAPFSGIMANVNVVTGQSIRSGEEILTLLSKALVLECLILESDLPMVHIGQETEVSGIANPALKIKGKVVKINPIVESTGMAKVSIGLILGGPDGVHRGLYSGMHGHAVIMVPSRRSLLVPKEAVVVRGNRPVVFTIIGNQAKWNYVEVGKNNGVEVEITSGLKNGDKVIVSNNLQLAHEAVVVE